jgi:hypothetical protein
MEIVLVAPPGRRNMDVSRQHRDIFPIAKNRLITVV